MLANIPAILKHLNKEGQAARAGQMSMFDAPATEDMKLVELPDWSEHERLWHERKALGTFVSGHPLDRYRDKIAGKVTHQCREGGDMLLAGNNVRQVVAGLVRSYRRLPRVAYLTIEDGTGALDIFSFSDEADRFAHCLMQDAIIAVQVKPHFRGDSASLRLVNAFRLGHFRSPR